MSGNVFEWCNDWYGNYDSNLQSNPQGPNSGTDRVIRGGSWNVSLLYARVSARLSLSPSIRYTDRGFRLACDAK